MKMSQESARKDELITADLGNLREDAKDKVLGLIPRLREQNGKQQPSHRGDSRK